MTTLLSKIRAAQPTWFSLENKRFFNDVKYYAYKGKITHKPYLVRSTFMWSDMLGEPKTLCFRVDTVNPDTLMIEGLTDDVFKTLQEAKEWVFEH
jgi:uncharacterized protein YqgV (UPF0045/DUF77 family)